MKKKSQQRKAVIKTNKVDAPSCDAVPSEDAKLMECLKGYPWLSKLYDTCKLALDEHGPDSLEFNAAAAKFQEEATKIVTTSPTSPIAELLKQGNDPLQVSASRTQLHAADLTGLLYEALINGPVYSTLASDPGIASMISWTSVLYSRDVLERMAASNPMEQMLLSQALWIHGRIARLNFMLANTSCLDEIRMLCEALDRATNTFRRLMNALDEHRRPPASLKQTNIAGQQIVQNNLGTFAEPSQENLSNEQGSHDAPTDAKSLSTDRSWETIPAEGGPAESPLDQVNRPQDSGRKG